MLPFHVDTQRHLSFQPEQETTMSRILAANKFPKHAPRRKVSLNIEKKHTLDKLRAKKPITKINVGIIRKCRAI